MVKIGRYVHGKNGQVNPEWFAGSIPALDINLADAG